MGLSWTLFEQSHYVAPLHWLTSFENSNQGGIQPLSTAKLLKWPKIQTLSLSETRSLPVYCVLQLSHGLVLSLSANIKCYSSAHNLTWDPTHNQRIDGHKSDQRPPSPVDWVLNWAGFNSFEVFRRRNINSLLHYLDSRHITMRGWCPKTGGRAAINGFN